MSRWCNIFSLSLSLQFLFILFLHPPQSRLRWFSFSPDHFWLTRCTLI
jgi:hypothetical protein